MNMYETPDDSILYYFEVKRGEEDLTRWQAAKALELMKKGFPVRIARVFEDNMALYDLQPDLDERLFQVIPIPKTVQVCGSCESIWDTSDEEDKACPKCKRVPTGAEEEKILKSPELAEILKILPQLE